MSLREYNNIHLSIELIRLLQWIVEHESDALKQIIERSNGQQHKKPSLLEALQNPIFNSEEGIKDQIVQFFSVLENLIHESAGEEEQSQQLLQRFLVPSLKNIDSSNCDIEAINISAENARNAVENGTTNNSKEALCRELMKQWNPHIPKAERH